MIGFYCGDDPQYSGRRAELIEVEGGYEAQFDTGVERHSRIFFPTSDFGNIDEWGFGNHGE